MAQHVGAATSALFVEQAEASVADEIVPQNAARVSRRVPGMRRDRNMAGPRLRKAYSLCTTIDSSAIVPCCKCKIEIGSSCPSLLTTLLPRQESFASLHILTRRASEGSEALPSLARRVRMSFFGARVILFGESSEKSAGWIRKKTRSERRTLQKVATLPVAKTSTTSTSRQSRHQIPADLWFRAH